jgi:hypothetical protein
VNSEELEQSLRTEFESYLKTVVAGIRQEVSEFQKKVDAEFEKHKSQMDEAFRDFNERFVSDKELEEAFSETVAEHLRLARDEGARITATAIAEAEELEKQNTATTDSSFVVSELRDAIRDISSKTTQSAILKALVAHAAKFTPRGAFFIIKNEHLVGWRVFGNEAEMDDKSVREVFFPTGNETLIGESVRNLQTAEAAYGNYSDDSLFLNRLNFGHPDRMYSIPLIVRERAVAALYADYGTEGSNVNLEALEMLVQVAGMTVEISASARSARSLADEHHVEHEEAEPVVTHDEPAVPAYDYYAEPTESAVPEEVERQETFSDAHHAEFEPAQAEFEPAQAEFEPAQAEFEPAEQEIQSSYSFSDSSSVEVETAPNVDESYSVTETESDINEFTASEESPSDFEMGSSFEFTPSDEGPAVEWSETVSDSEEYSAPGYETPEFESFEPATFETSEEGEEYVATPVSEYEFETVQPAAASGFEFESTSAFEAPPAFDVEEPVAAAIVEAVPEPVLTVGTTRSRLSERNVDLPIEVSEDERRLHNDARRFARLLVSEIKLYNEQKVKEGRESSELYDKLREAIDRSREMYDKRVQPPVAAKFDYFHYELVSNLAEGDEGKLGSAYPGSTI